MARKISNRTIVIATSLAAVGMVGMAYAAVPLYDLFCRVTGYGGTTQIATGEGVEAIDRTVTVRFDGSLARGVPLEFKPAQTTQTVKLGERALAYYEATNLSDRPIVGTATYNVAPFKAGGYFMKVDCFCFTEQRFEPGQTVSMPVLYYVDPEMDGAANLDDVRGITLSYTFFLKKDEESLAARGAAERPPGG